MPLRAQGLALDKDPKNWFDAFDALRELVEMKDTGKRRIIFLDEMPWMDNKKSDFVPALEHFWNGWGSGQKNLMLVTCGSAASWITKKVFRNKGGLYNRVTRQIRLRPFTLAECKEYFEHRKIAMNGHDIIESYMIFGGIPYYLNMLNRKYSLALNVDALCFAEDAPLKHEFSRLFESLFDHPEKYIEVCSVINARKSGLPRERIAGAVRFGNGGNLTRILNELEESGFIRRYKPFGKARNGALYQLTDPFVAFHLDFITKENSENYWSSFTDNARHRAWSGYAFEQVCLSHITVLKKALGISGVLSDISAWRSGAEKDGAQIDLIIDRNDNVINLCEMKYSGGEYAVDGKDDRTLRNKVGAFARETGTRKALHLTLVTTYGLKPGKYASVFQSQVVMDDLFAD
jgi:hypothetical protein